MIVMHIVPSMPSLCAHAMHVITLHYSQAYGLMPLEPHSEQAWQIMGNCTSAIAITLEAVLLLMLQLCPPFHLKKMSQISQTCFITKASSIAWLEIC